MLLKIDPLGYDIASPEMLKCLMVTFSSDMNISS